jgi:hypothetical protein
MILKASQRGGPRQLAAHLLNDKENDHVTLHEIRGFISGDLGGAMAETMAIARGTRCRQPVFSLSLNPPRDAQASVGDLVAAVDRAESALGLQGQPRAIVIHEKAGRQHAHVVWSRINAEQMKAINLPHFKNRLTALSKELYLEHGWALPDGHRENGWTNPLNFTLAEWQQAKRHDLDPREIKQIFQAAWERSDNWASFRSAMESHGYFLARGDRRGVVALDVHGEIYAVSRWAGIKTKDVAARLGDASLPRVAETRRNIERRLAGRAREILDEDKQKKAKELKPVTEQLRMLVSHHRKERALLLDRQQARWRQETAARAGRFRRGLGAVMDILTGRLFGVKRQNEREAYECFIRDRSQQQSLVHQQAAEKRELVERIAALRESQRRERRDLVRRLLIFSGRIHKPERERSIEL